MTSHQPGELEPGAIFGGYRIVRLLGAGGMGAVYEAVQLSLDRPVALKVLLPGLARDELARRRFLQEGRLAARVSHPHLVNVLDVAEVDGRLMLAHELVAGETLERRLAGGGLPVELALEVACVTADVLATLHHAGILHRDLKPANLFLSSDRGVLVGDLGIAKDRLSGGLTSAGFILGTPLYMAPEIWQGKPPGAVSDLYALGVMLFECLAGRTPFSSEDPAELSRLHSTGSVPSVRLWRPELPAEHDALLRRALAKDPGGRFPDAAAFASALQELPRVQESQTLPPRQAAPSGTRVRASRPASGRQVAATIAPQAAPPRRFWPWLVAIAGIAAIAALPLLEPSPPVEVTVPPSPVRSRFDPARPGAWLVAPTLPGDEALAALLKAHEELRSAHEQNGRNQGRLRGALDKMLPAAAVKEALAVWKGPMPACRTALRELREAMTRGEPGAAGKGGRLLASLLLLDHDIQDSFGYTMQLWFKQRASAGDIEAEWFAGNSALDLRRGLAQEALGVYEEAFAARDHASPIWRAGFACLMAVVEGALPRNNSRRPSSDLVGLSLVELTSTCSGEELLVVRGLARALRAVSAEKKSIAVINEAIAELDAQPVSAARAMARYDLLYQRNWAERELRTGDERDAPEVVERLLSVWVEARNRIAHLDGPDAKARLSEVKGWIENASRTLKRPVPPLSGEVN